MEIVLQRNEITVQVSVGQQNARLCHMSKTLAFVTTHHHTTSWPEIYPEPLQSVCAYLTRALTFATPFCFMCGFDVLCLSPVAVSANDLLAQDQTAVYF